MTRPATAAAASGRRIRAPMNSMPPVVPSCPVAHAGHATPMKAVPATGGDGKARRV